MKIVFFGTSEFGAIILEKMVQAGYSPVLVVTTPNMPVGRKQIPTPPPVRPVALKFNIPVIQPEKLDHDTSYKLQNTSPDLFVVAAYGKILPKAILDIPKYGALNVHPSLLPEYRGPSPVQTALLDGAEETGVSIMLMDEEIDHGAIVANTKYQIRDTKYTYEELHNQLAELGGNLLVQTIPQWVAGKLKPAPQDHSQATHTKRFAKQDARIDWSKNAEYIERQVRAFHPWPGTFTLVKDRGAEKMLKIRKARVLPQGERALSQGEIFAHEDGLAVQTGNGILLIEKLQLEGGTPMSSKEFLLGHKNFAGTILL